MAERKMDSYLPFVSLPFFKKYGLGTRLSKVNQRLTLAAAHPPRRGEKRAKTLTPVSGDATTATATPWTEIKFAIVPAAKLCVLMCMELFIDNLTI